MILINICLLESEMTSCQCNTILEASEMIDYRWNRVVLESGIQFKGVLEGFLFTDRLGSSVMGLIDFSVFCFMFYVL